MKHLDREYRRRCEKFYLEDGTVKDSREINWRDVEWEKVVKITVHLEDHIHTIEKGKSKGFMNFRWTGKEAQYKGKEFTGMKPVNIWTVGTIYEKKAKLQDFDFYTGEKVKEYEMDLKELKNHIHPRLKIKL